MEAMRRMQRRTLWVFTILGFVAGCRGSSSPTEPAAMQPPLEPVATIIDLGPMLPPPACMQPLSQYCDRTPPGSCRSYADEILNLQTLAARSCGDRYVRLEAGTCGVLQYTISADGYANVLRYFDAAGKL